MNNKFKMAEYMLYEYKYIDDKLDILKFKLESMKNDVSLNSIDYSDDRVSPTNAFNSSVENEVVKREEKIASVQAEINRLEYNKTLIDKVIKLLDPEEKEMIELRYFSKPRNSWTYIEHKLSISHDCCWKKKNKIIDKISSLLV